MIGNITFARSHLDGQEHEKRATDHGKQEPVTSHCVICIPRPINTDILQFVDEDQFQDTAYQLLRRESLSQVDGFIKWLRPNTTKFANSYLDFLYNCRAMKQNNLSNILWENFLTELEQFIACGYELSLKYDNVLQHSHFLKIRAQTVLSEMAMKRKIAEDEAKKMRINIWLHKFRARFSDSRGWGSKKESSNAIARKEKMRTAINNVEVVIVLQQSLEETLKECRDTLAHISNRLKRIKRNVTTARSLSSEISIEWISSFPNKDIDDHLAFVIGLQNNHNLLPPQLIKTKLNIRDRNDYRLVLEK